MRASVRLPERAAARATGEADSFRAAAHWRGETKRLGQVPTPEPVAQLMAEWVMSSRPRTVLDPAAGLGGLLAACRRLRPQVGLVGVERDPRTWERACATAPRDTQLVQADYLVTDFAPFDGIIANPPYVKADRLAFADEDWQRLEQRLGAPLDRRTNLYALFLLKIWQDLAPGGRAAVLLPAEFLNANFGEPIKRRLVHELLPAALLVFSPELRLFPDALTTSALVCFDKSEPRQLPAWGRLVRSVPEAAAWIRSLQSTPPGTSSSAGNASTLDLRLLQPGDKWLNLFLHGATTSGAEAWPRRVGDYFKCRRGIATGANDYFCLDPAGLRRHELNEQHVAPCITKAVDAGGLVFTRAKHAALAASGRRCYLLNPARVDAALARYLAAGEARGLPQRHLPRHRPVWYRPENRPVADIWAAVFSRGQAKFILNTSGAKNLTCFHGLYVRAGAEHLAGAMTIFLNSTAGRRAFSRVNRFYGDGLAKLEPKDVEAMPCPEMPALTAADAERLRRRLGELEEWLGAERIRRIDELANELFRVTG